MELSACSVGPAEGLLGFLGEIFHFSSGLLTLFLNFFSFSHDCHTFCIVTYNENITAIDLCWCFFSCRSFPLFLHVCALFILLSDVEK